jgi:hypothetical protein
MTLSSELESSFLSRADYNQLDKSLTVSFKNGSKFSYQDVPQSVYEELSVAEKPSGYFNSKIKDGFNFRKIG